MRKPILIISALLLMASSTTAVLPKFGIGVFGGLNIPVVQQDQGNGTLFGVRGRLKVLPFAVFEPNATFGKFGDPDDIEGIDLGNGSDFNSFGLDVTLGGLPGVVAFKPFLVVGIGSYTTKNDMTKVDNSDVGYSVGLGVGLGFSPKFDIDVRGKAIIIPIDEGGSKKTINATVGLTYNIGAL
ncbi:MAG: outer membrane beta-barrel protein [candidate division Zixibacteria bacterium]|nr:outer membrane beta-barrel protein [candidate division Zixibacteria bacterium]